MATYYLGPEYPVPFSALSESRSDDSLRQLMKHRCEETLHNSFDRGYRYQLQSLLQRYLDLDFDDRICYIGIDLELMKLFEDVNFLRNKIVVLHPGTITCDGGNDQHPIHETTNGIDEHFAVTKGRVECFDKIIVHDSLIFIRRQLETLSNISRSLSKKGKLLILHRSHDTNTLPIFKRAKEKMEQHDKSHVEIIQDLQKCGMQLSWNMEFLKCKMNKFDWLSRISQKQPPHLNICSFLEVREGIRDLSEGVFKYEDGILEFQDQLVFIEASHFDGPHIVNVPNEKNEKTKGLGLQYELLVTPEVHSFIRFLNIKKLPMK